jgi:cyclopropane fatty-acyl-phospholipid synthase-like methyltransferase
MCVEAARRYKARCVGIELDDALVEEARLNAQRSGLDDRITILKQNALEVDYTCVSFGPIAVCRALSGQGRVCGAQ